jgi:hypothetical protein
MLTGGCLTAAIFSMPDDWSIPVTSSPAGSPPVVVRGSVQIVVPPLVRPAPLLEKRVPTVQHHRFIILGPPSTSLGIADRVPAAVRVSSLLVSGIPGGHRGWSTLILLICGSVGAAGAGAG